MAMRDILDRQANSIEYILHTHGIKGHVDGGKLSPRLAHFHLMLPPGVRATVLAPIVPEIADELGVTACRMSHGEEGIYLEVPRPDPVPVRLLPIIQRVADVVPPVTATLGLDGEGTPLLLRLNSPDVDPLLVVGNRGAGKSSLLGGMALSLALHNSPDHLRLLLIDATGEGRAFRGLESLPHLACPVANNLQDALMSLRWAVRTMSRHASAYDPLLDDGDEDEEDELSFGEMGGEVDNRAFEPVRGDEPSLVVLVDGADLLCRNGNRRVEGEAQVALNKLLAGGSRHNIHLVLATERPDGLDMLEGGWGSRVVGQVATPEAARQATGVTGTGAQGLMGGGDFLILLNTELIRFQAPAVSSAELARAVSLIVSCAQAQSSAQDEEERLEPESEQPSQYDKQYTGRSALHPAMLPEQRRHEEPLPLRRTWVGE